MNESITNQMKTKLKSNHTANSFN